MFPHSPFWLNRLESMSVVGNAYSELDNDIEVHNYNALYCLQKTEGYIKIFFYKKNHESLCGTLEGQIGVFLNPNDVTR